MTNEEWNKLTEEEKMLQLDTLKVREKMMAEPFQIKKVDYEDK